MLQQSARRARVALATVRAGRRRELSSCWSQFRSRAPPAACIRAGVIETLASGGRCADCAVCTVVVRAEKCVGPKPQQYVFHLSDETCAINDPNGPFYDEVNPTDRQQNQQAIAFSRGTPLPAGTWNVP